MTKFNFQMFDEKQLPQISGIDEDVMALLADEIGAEVQPAVEEEQAEPAGAADTVAEADTAAEQELAELKARMQQPPVQQVAAPPANAQGVQQQSAQQEIMNAVTAEAIRRTKIRMGITDEDMANMEFADSLDKKVQFQTMAQQEANNILEGARANAQRRAAYESQVKEASTAFSAFVDEFQAQPDAADRWTYISEERFLQLPPLEQSAIKSAFERLQRREGTPGDFYLAKSYFDRASAEFTANHAAPRPVVQEQKPAVSAAAKVKKAQALPKAPQVQGAMSTPGMSVEDVARLLNEPGSAGLDKIPPDILQKVLSGQPIG